MLLPSGEGLLLDSKQVTANFDSRLAPRWDLRFAALALHNSAPSAFTGRQDRKFVSIEPALEYELTRWWGLSVSYRYRWQSYEDEQNDAVSNAVFLNLTYVWPTEPVPSWEQPR
jgi:hypothetical protein